MESKSLNTIDSRCRATVAITRNHQPFVIKALSYSSQYNHYYYLKLAELRPRAMQKLKEVLKKADPAATSEMLEMTNSSQFRILHITPGSYVQCCGILFKQMAKAETFLSEYQKELVRIDTGDDADDLFNNDGLGVIDNLSKVPKTIRSQNSTITGGSFSNSHSDGAQVVANRIDPEEPLFLEDESGRMQLEGISSSKMPTGVVLSAYGFLQENGKFHVSSFALPGIPSWVDRFASPHKSFFSGDSPKFIAIISGLQLDSSISDKANHYLLLQEFLNGLINIPQLFYLSSRIGRIIIGGNSISKTFERQVKDKVILDHIDHRLLNELSVSKPQRLNSDKRENKRFKEEKTSFSPPCTSQSTMPSFISVSQLMEELDAFLIPIAESIDVELMPGSNDPTTALLPYQPIHPVLLPRISSLSTVNLVTNPFIFTVKEDNQSTKFSITDGINVDNILKNTEFSNSLDVLKFLCEAGDLFPTVPQLLLGHPFKTRVPFLLETLPHCMISCNQKQFETRWISLEEFETCSQSSSNPIMELDHSNSNDIKNREVLLPRGVRLISCPSFSHSYSVVLVNINSPTLETFEIQL